LSMYARTRGYLRSTSSPRSFSILNDVQVERRDYLSGAALGSRRRAVVGDIRLLRFASLLEA
jgi:hypothetical protein